MAMPNAVKVTPISHEPGGDQKSGDADGLEPDEECKHHDNQPLDDRRRRSSERLAEHDLAKTGATASLSETRTVYPR